MACGAKEKEGGEGGEADATTIRPPPPPLEKEEEKWELGMQPENRGKEGEKETSRGGKLNLNFLVEATGEHMRNSH